MASHVQHGLGLPAETYLAGKAWAEGYAKDHGYHPDSFYEVVLMFAHLDPYQHVNNARFNDFVGASKNTWNAELVRKHVAGRPLGSSEESVLVEVTYKYRFPATWPDVLFIASRIGRVDEKGFDTESIILSIRQRRVICEALGRDRAYNVKEAKPSTLSDWYIKLLKEYQRDARRHEQNSSKL